MSIFEEVMSTKDHNFPYTYYEKTQRRFVPNWFDKFVHWLEYSKSKDAAFFFLVIFLEMTVFIVREMLLLVMDLNLV